MKQIFLGKNPLTTIAGYLLAGLVAAKQLLSEGTTEWYNIALAVGIAILGRVAADTTNSTNN
jgi:hypothetical protein